MCCGDDHHDTVLFQLAAEKSDRPQPDRVEVQQISHEVDRLDDLRQKAAGLRGQGIQVVDPEQIGAGMDKTIELCDLDGNRIQFYGDMDQFGWGDKSRPPSQWRRQKRL